MKPSDFKVIYDEKQDVLFLRQEGQKEKAVELAPGIIRMGVNGGR
jgi:hypothetical protein